MTKVFGIETEEEILRGEKQKTANKSNRYFAFYLFFPSYVLCVENKGK